ncbi:flagellar basal body-associated protein FliL [Roseovarius atlanticus]|uniref:Flagellar protein FliL n=1 Tax=Roseovarius atlanticus TaxID=1641875 RepID=A0A0T5NRF9_9RHOB|nr:flagellar basal body-associated FliL family protein [Roseovarius atlanticus]KRS11310.1 flagellar basal body-associated protein FliL [Roseovarius atlanticus]
MRKLIPILMALLGIGAGVGAGIALRPDPAEVVEMHPCGETDQSQGAQDTSAKDHDADAPEEETTHEYVKLNNQFVVPVVTNDLVNSLVVMSLSVEVAEGQSEVIYAREPKLRDAFLQVLFDHANVGGFEGEFTNANNMDILRASLRETAQGLIGDVVRSILITDIARQDV